MSLKLQTHSEQVAAHLRGELMRGRWRNLLPGVHKLSADLDVNHNTIHAALQLLEEEGLLTSQGRGRPRRVTLPRGTVVTKTLRLKILCYEWLDRGQPYTVELLARLKAAGFAPDFAKKSLQDLGFDAKRVAAFIETYPADAWMVIGGNRETLEWFANSGVPALAIFGRFSGVDIAASGIHKLPILVTILERLYAMGHRRIVLLARKERRLPDPGLFEQKFLDELEHHGLAVGAYNLPDWEENPAGLLACLDSLFKHTPPTALLISEPAVYIAVERYLIQRGIKIPEQVSMLCTQNDPVFNWHDPIPAHMVTDLRPVTNRAIRWATNVAQGKKDRDQKTFKVKWIEGGTLGPAPKENI